MGFDDVSVLPVAALPGAILEVARERRRLEVLEAALLARLEASGFTQVDSGHVTATWMSNTMQRPRSACVQRVKAATAMAGTFSRLGAAIEAGDFTLEHLEAVLRVANHRVMDALVEGQEQLLAIAENTTFTEFERHLRSLVHLLDQDGPFDPNDEREASRLTIRHTPGWHPYQR